MIRLVLWYVLAWMYEYPKSLAVRTLAPDHIHPKPAVNTIWRYIRMGLQHLAAVMAEISVTHLQHKNNCVSHFPKGVYAAWDTFPIVVQHGPHRYQPKYKGYVTKWQGIVSFLGMFAVVSGPHPGAFSDTTLARHCRPALRPDMTILADLAYMSVPNCLTPIKADHVLSVDEEEFNRIV